MPASKVSAYVVLLVYMLGMITGVVGIENPSRLIASTMLVVGFAIVLALPVSRN